MKKWQPENKCTHDWKFFGECPACKAQKEQREAVYRCEKEQAKQAQLNRIESMLIKLLDIHNG